MLGGAFEDELAVGRLHPLRAPAVAERGVQRVEVAVADRPPEVRVLRGVAERDVDVAGAGQRDVGAFERDVVAVAEVEDGVQPERGEEGRVLLVGVREVAAAEEHPRPYPPAVGGGQPAHVAEVAHPGQLGFRAGRGGLPHFLRHRCSFSSSLPCHELRLPRPHRATADDTAARAKAYRAVCVGPYSVRGRSSPGRTGGMNHVPSIRPYGRVGHSPRRKMVRRG